MTDRDRIYIAACKLPPSVERTTILETVVREARLPSVVCDGKFADLDSHIVNFCVEPGSHAP
jgi:hypothetical protein